MTCATPAFEKLQNDPLHTTFKPISSACGNACITGPHFVVDDFAENSVKLGVYLDNLVRRW